MGRRRGRISRQRWARAYRASPLCRHRKRVRWLQAQRTRLHDYLRRFPVLENEGSKKYLQ